MPAVGCARARRSAAGRSARGAGDCLSSSASSAWKRSMMPLVKSQRSTPSPDAHLGADAVARRYRRAAGGDIRQKPQPARRPLDRYRIGSDTAHVPLQGDRHVLAVDLAFHEAIHGVEEILAVIAGMKPQDVGRQHVQQHFALPRTHAESLGIGPGDVPEQRDRRLGYFLADELRQQREMEILYQDHGTVGVRFGGHDLGELGVHFLVGAPIAGAKRRPHIGQMAQRPQPFIGEPIVVSLLLSSGVSQTRRRV